MHLNWERELNLKCCLLVKRGSWKQHWAWVIILSRSKVQFHSSGRSNLESPNILSNNKNDNNIMSKIVHLRRRHRNFRHRSWRHHRQCPTCSLRWSPGRPVPSAQLPRFGLADGSSTVPLLHGPIVFHHPVVSYLLSSSGCRSGRRWAGTGSPWLNPNMTGRIWRHFRCGPCLRESSSHHYHRTSPPSWTMLGGSAQDHFIRFCSQIYPIHDFMELVTWKWKPAECRVE